MKSKLVLFLGIIGLSIAGCSSNQPEQLEQSSKNKEENVCEKTKQLEIYTGEYAVTKWNDTGVEKAFAEEPPVTPTERWYFVRTINSKNGKTRIYAQQMRDCYEITKTITTCEKTTSTVRTDDKNIDVDGNTYKLWQEGTGDFPDRTKLDKKGIDFAVYCDHYDKKDDGSWELTNKNKVHYLNDSLINLYKIGDTWTQANQKIVLKKWIIIPIQYKEIDGSTVRMASLSKEYYINDIWNQIALNSYWSNNDDEQ